MGDFPGSDPFNRAARNAAQMIADYKPDHRGYAPDHYQGDTMETAGTYLIETITDLTAVHVFNDKIVVVDAEGEVTTYRIVG